jgi:hypothetical protein
MSEITHQLGGLEWSATHKIFKVHFKKKKKKLRLKKKNYFRKIHYVSLRLLGN